MSDIKVFRVTPTGFAELPTKSASIEKSLQTLFEANLEALLGVRFLAGEYVTGKAHGGRIDALGIDEYGCPVIIEYNRTINENIISQQLFHLDWLLDHRKEFQWLVMETPGTDAAKAVEWSAPRLLCIAGDFTDYDRHAVKQINRISYVVRRLPQGRARGHRRRQYQTPDRRERWSTSPRSVIPGRPGCAQPVSS
ncbi:hypothetical protein [Azospirillum halopraeferens]|uniref:hypothetical protein n=1 Tax=Azospirillum halopraeferens TaxID=34010 RepID=UPI000416560C|nr:hypothetical protein [Azospirillum halopraeferens]